MEECRVNFGATRVGGLLARVHMHLATDRFLAERRGDAFWQAGCAAGKLAVERIMSRMKPRTLAKRVLRRVAVGRR